MSNLLHISKYGGAIYFSFDSLKEENGCSLSIVDCYFNLNDASGNGGSIYIIVEKNEPSNPIEISRCFFNLNGAYSRTLDILIGYGGAISYIHKQTTFSKRSDIQNHY